MGSCGRKDARLSWPVFFRRARCWSAAVRRRRRRRVCLERALQTRARRRRPQGSGSSSRLAGPSSCCYVHLRTVLWQPFNSNIVSQMKPLQLPLPSGSVCSCRRCGTIEYRLERRRGQSIPICWLCGHPLINSIYGRVYHQSRLLVILPLTADNSLCCDFKRLQNSLLVFDLSVVIVSFHILSL